MTCANRGIAAGHPPVLMSAYAGTPDSAAATFINYNFQGKVLGTNGAVAFAVNPARAVLVTGVSRAAGM